MTYVAARTSGKNSDTLVFTFHGTGGDEHQFHDLASRLMPGAAVVSPRGDVSEGGMNRYFRRKAEGVYDMDDLWARTEAMADFLRSEKDAAGATRVIGLGYSNGANILIAVALKHPNVVTDLVLMHPLIPWSPDPQPGLSGVRGLVTAGRHDPICPASDTEDLVRYFTKQGMDLSVDWHSGGHEIRQEEVAAIQRFLA